MSSARTIEDSERALGKAAALLREQIRGDLPYAVHEQGRQNAMLAFSGRSKTKAPRTYLPLVAAAALILMMTLGGTLIFREPPLAYRGIDAHASQEGVVALDGKVPRGGIRFSDGTLVMVERGARLQVVDVDAHGARVALDEGHARFHVVHKEGARWHVAAGPYAVKVTGTRFALSWSSVQRRFELSLEDGSVTIHGPQIPQGVHLSAGQKLIASSMDDTVRIVMRDEAEQASAPTLPSPQVLPANEKRVRPSKQNETVSWTYRVKGGEFQSVLSEARARGIELVLRQAPLADLVALADAARYAREFSLSERALLAQRRRFGSSNRARDAAFLLGRISEDKAESEAIALRWYDQYLREAPSGTFAAEALGRKMLAVHRTRGISAAAPIAREYLARFANGPYAARARELKQAE